ncbi:hypothetical protein ANN_24268, partial [Periplaneta americana]
MASASSTSARSLFVDSKLRLADRVQVNVNNIASVARQIQRGARSNEVTGRNSLPFTLKEGLLSHNLFANDSTDACSAKFRITRTCYRKYGN